MDRRNLSFFEWLDNQPYFIQRSVGWLMTAGLGVVTIGIIDGLINLFW